MTTAALERPQFAPPAPAPVPSTSGPSWARRAGFAGGVAAFIAIALTPSALHEISGAGHRPAFAATIAARTSTSPDPGGGEGLSGREFPVFLRGHKGR